MGPNMKDNCSPLASSSSHALNEICFHQSVPCCQESCIVSGLLSPPQTRYSTVSATTSIANVVWRPQESRSSVQFRHFQSKFYYHHHDNTYSFCYSDDCRCCCRCNFCLSIHYLTCSRVFLICSWSTKCRCSSVPHIIIQTTSSRILSDSTFLLLQYERPHRRLSHAAAICVVLSNTPRPQEIWKHKMAPETFFLGRLNSYISPGKRATQRFRPRLFRLK